MLIAGFPGNRLQSHPLHSSYSTHTTPFRAYPVSLSLGKLFWWAKGDSDFHVWPQGGDSAHQFIWCVAISHLNAAFYTDPLTHWAVLHILTLNYKQSPGFWPVYQPMSESRPSTRGAWDFIPMHAEILTNLQPPSSTWFDLMYLFSKYNHRKEVPQIQIYRNPTFLTCFYWHLLGVYLPRN